MPGRVAGRAVDARSEERLRGSGSQVTLRAKLPSASSEVFPSSANLLQLVLRVCYGCLSGREGQTTPAGRQSTPSSSGSSHRRSSAPAQARALVQPPMHGPRIPQLLSIGFTELVGSPSLKNASCIVSLGVGCMVAGRDVWCIDRRSNQSSRLRLSSGDHLG